jgi:hypothetical protein
MVTLIDGKGQLGEALQKVFGKYDFTCIIYHTWNIDDPSEEAQKREYDKFVKFVDNNMDEKIYFISTKQGRQIHYLHYKLKAELYLLEVARDGHIIRIPKLIGKGIFADFRDGKIKPFSEVEEIITPDDVALQIMELLRNDDKMNVVIGELIDKRTTYNLIQFGAVR